MAATPSAAEVAAVDAALGPPDRTPAGLRSNTELCVSEARRDAAPGRRQLLLPALWAVQHAAGWISAGALTYVCERLEVPPAEAFGVADSYALLSTQPRPPRVTHVCDDVVCRSSGAEALCAELERALGPAGAGEAGSDPETWQRSPCLGLCERAPAAFVQSAGEADRVLAPAAVDVNGGGLAVAAAAPSSARSAAQAAPQTAEPRAEDLRLLRRVGVVDPDSLDDYRAHGGYAALRLARELGGERVVRALEEARAARPRRCGVPGRPQVGGRRARPGAPALRGLQRRRVRARHLQGPRADGARPLRRDRGDDDRRPRDGRGARLPLRPRRVRARRRAPAGGDRAGARPRAARQRRDGVRLPLRHRAAARRRRLHLRRGDGAVQLDRGLPRRAAQQAAVPDAGRALRQAHAREQRRDARQRARHRARGRARLRGDRHGCLGRFDRHEAVLRRGQRRPPRRLRGALRDDAGRAAGARGRTTRRRDRRDPCSAAPRARS